MHRHHSHSNVLSHTALSLYPGATAKHWEAGATDRVWPSPSSSRWRHSYKDFALVCGELLVKAQIDAWPPNSQLPALLPDAEMAPDEARQIKSPRFILPDMVFSGDSCQACQSLRRVWGGRSSLWQGKKECPSWQTEQERTEQAWAAGLLSNVLLSTGSSVQNYPEGTELNQEHQESLEIMCSKKLKKPALALRTEMKGNTWHEPAG